MAGGNAVKQQVKENFKTILWSITKLGILFILYLTTKSFPLMQGANEKLYMYIFIFSALIIFIEFFVQISNKNLFQQEKSQSPELFPCLALVIVLVLWNFSFFLVYQRDYSLSWTMKKAQSGYFMESAAFSLGNWENTTGQFYAFLSDFFSENELVLTLDSYSTPHLSFLRNFKVVDIRYRISDQAFHAINADMLEAVKRDYLCIEYQIGMESEYRYLFVLDHMERKNTQVITLPFPDDANLVIFIPQEDYQSLIKIEE